MEIGLNQDGQQYCLGTVIIKLFTRGGGGNIKPGRPTVLSWNGQHQNCSLQVEVGRLNQDIQQYCPGTVNTKTLQGGGDGKLKPGRPLNIVLLRSILKLFTGGGDGKTKPGHPTVLS